MSTMPMATACTEIDPTLGDDTEVTNCICIMLATQSNGIPLCPTYYTEEGAVKLCIGFGQEHTEGVLWFLDTEIVLTFWCDLEMMAKTCHLAVAVAWHSEPIKLHIWPPTSVQARNYIATRTSCPIGTQVPVQDRGWLPGLSPVSPALMMGSQPAVIRDVWDLDDYQLREVLEALQLEMARQEGVAPPHGSPQGSLRIPGGSSKGNMYDGEVGLRGGWDADQVSPWSGLQLPLRPIQMLATSSACFWPG